MAYDIELTAMSWPVIAIVISGGSLISIVLIVVICSCCFKTSVPVYKAKVQKNVVAKENLKRNTPEKKRQEYRRTQPSIFIYNGTPARTGGWNDVFVKDGNHVPRIYNHGSLNTPANPPDVIIHAAIARHSKQEPRSSSRPHSVVSPTSPRPLRSPGSRPSISFEELLQDKYRDDEGPDSSNVPGTPLREYPSREETTQEENRNGSILVYKPRRESHRANVESRSRIQSSNDPVTSRIEELIQQRGGTPSDQSDTSALPRFDRTSGEWDNVPKPGRNRDTPPPLPSRNYSIEDSDLTDCSEIMPTPYANKVGDHTVIDMNERQNRHRQRNLSHKKSAENSRHSSHSSAISHKNGLRSPEILLPHPSVSSNVFQNSSPGNDNVFVPNENPAYVHGSSTPPSHTPKKNPPRKTPRRPRQRNIYENVNGVREDTQFVKVNEAQRHKRVEDLRREESPRRHDENKIRPGVYLRPKPYYPYPGGHEKRYSDASDYSEYLSGINKCYSDQIPEEHDPYFFRSRWSAVYDNSPDNMINQRHNSGFLTDQNGEISREIKDEPFRKIRDGRFNSDVVEYQIANTQPPGNKSPGNRQDYSSNDSSPDISRQRRQNSQKSTRLSSSPVKPKIPQRNLPRVSRQDAIPNNSPHKYSSPKHQSPVKRARNSYHSPRSQPQTPLEALVERHPKEDRDVLVSPNRQQNYPGDVARIRRGLQKSNSVNKARGYSRLTSYPCPEANESQQTRATTDSLAPPNNHPLLSKRPSSDYGSLIDILYRYRQNVRKSREKEKPGESPESRLRFERQKLKTKLKEELEPREMQSKNVEMVIETLLYLCETDSSKNKKRSWQRENNMETANRRPRPSSVIVTTPTDENISVPFSYYDEKRDDDYARIRSMSESRSSILQFEKAEIPTKKKEDDAPEMPERKYESKFQVIRPDPKRSVHEGFVVPQSAPPETYDKEFAFPSVEELNIILRQNRSPPPVPPRLDRLMQSQDDSLTPPPIAPRPFRNLPLTPDEEHRPEAQVKSDENSASGATYSQIPNGDKLEAKANKENVSKILNSRKEPDYARIRRKISRKRQRSLPSLTENEMRWLLQSGGNNEEVFKRKNESKVKPQGIKRDFSSQSTRMRDRSGAFLSTQDLPTPPEPPVEEKSEMMEATFSFDDIHVDENTDAEDIIKAVERKMSAQNSQASPCSVKSTERPSPIRYLKQKLPSDSEMGTLSSVASSGMPVTPPHRGRLIRYQGKPSSNEQTPSQSPVFLRNNFHTPPPDSDNDNKVKYSRGPSRVESMSPTPMTRPPRTPPANTRINYPRVTPSSNKHYQPSNISRSSPSTPARIGKSQGPFTPRKQHQPAHRPVSPKPASNPVSPSTGFKPNLGRRKSKFQPKIPFMGKKFVQSTAANDIVVSIDSDRRRISRTGEIIYLPEDDDYAEPFDSIIPGSGRNNNGSPHYLPQGNDSFSPRSPIFNIFDPSAPFYPIIIKEEGDYAVPVNQAPSELLQERIRARSMENLAGDIETSV